MNPLTPRTLWSIPRVASPTVSSEWIVVPVTTWSSDDGSTTTRLWRCDWDGDRMRPLTAPGRSSTRPVLSPDGSELAFVRTVDGEPQIHVMPMDGGEATQVSHLPDGVIGGIWHPDGDRMIVLSNVSSVDEDGLPDGVHATDHAVYRYWDRWLTDEAHPHLFLLDVRSGEAEDLTPDSRRWMRWENTGDPVADLAVSPDGSRVLFCADRSEPPHRDLRWSLFDVNLETRVVTDLTPDIPGHASKPRFSPAGRLVFGQQLVPDHYADPVRLTMLDDDGLHRPDTDDWDRSPSDWAWSDRGLVLTAEDRGRVRLFAWSPDTGGVPSALTSAGSVGGFDLAADGRLAFVRSSLVEPPEIHRLESAGPVRLTHFTDKALADVDLPSVGERWVEASDGDAIQVFTLSAVQGPAALVHLVHGGPHGIFGDTWHWRWNAAVMAGGDRIVAMANFAGSTSYGEAFTSVIHGAWGDRPARDIEAVTDHLVSEGIADDGRLALAGGSYGGYLVTWLATQTDRYRCIVAHAAVTDLPGMYASDITMGRARAYGAEAYEDLERVQRWSPLAHAGSIETPILVIHGDRDYRVPVGQGLALYGLLQAKGVETRLVHYDDEGHWILDGDRSIHWYEEVGAWLDAHLG